MFMHSGSIINKIGTMKVNEKKTLQGISGNIWTGLTDGQKRSLGRVFSQRVKSGDISDIGIYKEADQGQAAVYIKK